MNIAPKNFFKDENNILPLSGVSNIKTITCNENGYYAIYDSDRYGFNNPDGEWDKKNIEYFLIGDSFTDGACVNRPNDIGSILRKLSNKPVLNLGHSGNGPLLEYATLKEFLNPKVKKVIWNYYEGNDFYNLEQELNNKILSNYLEDVNFKQNLKLRQNEINSLARNKINEFENKISVENLLNFMKLTQTRTELNNYLPKNQKPDNDKSKKKLIKVFKKTLRLAKNFAAQNNSQLYFVYLPEYNRYVTSYDNNNYNIIKNIINELDIPFIDIDKEVFKKEHNPLQLFPFGLPDSHYNVEGYKKIANMIYEKTKE